MAQLNILHFPDDRLRIKAKPVEVEFRLEQFAHPGFHRLRQLARDNHDWLGFAHMTFPYPRLLNRPSGLSIKRFAKRKKCLNRPGRARTPNPLEAANLLEPARRAG